MNTSKIIHPIATPSPYEKKQRQKVSKALSNARQRCTNPNNKDYAAYGGAGIKVLFSCVDELIADIGLPPLKASLDRIDPTGHYEAGNVRWASKAVQAANKKSSLTGSTIPLHLLISQQKTAVQQEQLRPKVAEAWGLLLRVLSRGSLTQAEDAKIRDLLGLTASVKDTFGQRDVELASGVKRVFRLPSLTMPHVLVDATGPLAYAPDEHQIALFQRFGLLYGLRHLERQANVPTVLAKAIEALRQDADLPGLTLVGRPSYDDLTSGWFEVWMLAAASRLPIAGVTTANFPAFTCLELLHEFGGPSKWDYMQHPLLDARILFIPDFQLDCGPWGHLTNYQFGIFERLLQYRIDAELQTVVGVQAPHKLLPSLQKLLLGKFSVVEVSNGTKPAADAVSVFNKAPTPGLSGSEVFSVYV